MMCIAFPLNTAVKHTAWLCFAALLLSSTLCQNGCDDIQPRGNPFTCQQQKRFGKCSADWMVNGNFCRQTCGKCTPDQQMDCSSPSMLACDVSALLEFKNGMSSQAQRQLTSWQGDNPCAGWLGIICKEVVISNERGLRVNRIRLGEFLWEKRFGLWNVEENANFVGDMQTSLPVSIANNMLYLDELSLWNTGLQGEGLPVELSKLRDLEMIALGNNQYGGILPKQFSTWRDVEVVEFQGMGLTGNLPRQFQSWSQLRALNVRYNSLTGRIPAAYTTWVSGSRPISLQVFFVEQEANGLCASTSLVQQFTRRASLGTDINIITSC
eukprot:TRINITY_DN267_c0_g1_i1.p1 TRINITY_DN267_c0_g1~~TRINITY_DN267_c0_g1_i1.p1  ORF type:complete len:357 (-),score=17.38 TRINITY_DN267_c0_g1_i1:953-1927(-)